MMHKKQYTVYMLQCSDNSYYTGMTSDLDSRMYQHKTGQYKNAYTCKRLPLNLVYSAQFEDVYDAISWERRIKKWSRKKKEALIHSDCNALIELSVNQYKKRIDMIGLSIKLMIAIILRRAQDDKCISLDVREPPQNCLGEPVEP